MCIDKHVSSRGVLERDSESLRSGMEEGEGGRETVAQETKEAALSRPRLALLY